MYCIKTGKDWKTKQYHANQHDTASMNLLFILLDDNLGFTLRKSQYLFHSVKFSIVITSNIYLQSKVAYFEWLLYLMELIIRLESKYNHNYRNTLFICSNCNQYHFAWYYAIILMFSVLKWNEYYQIQQHAQLYQSWFR